MPAAMTFFVYAGCGTAVFFSTARISNYALSAASNEAPTTALPGLANDSALANAIGGQLSLLRSDLQINSSFGVNTALAFGMAIMVLVYAISHISGGHLNPAVTLSLFLSGHCGWVQAIGNMVAQFAGAILAAGLLYGTTSNPGSSSLGANSLSDGISNGNAVLGEIMMTCLLCFTVHMTAVDNKNRHNVGNFAPLAIGFAVFLGHAVLIPLDACSINPARSFGPAYLATGMTATSGFVSWLP
jgi:MIP family channel proteins